MLKTVRLGKVAGIDVYVHWSFWILLLWVVLSGASSQGWRAGLWASVFVCVVFACVFLHELGHALAAKLYHIRTHDITLLPFGGLARLESMPQGGLPEVVIALAGPAVNVAIASALFVGVLLYRGIEPILSGNPMQLELFEQLFAVNVMLAAFNMLPAFPMDGGRVLRAMLTIRLGHLRATEIAVRVGKYLALLMVVVGFFYSFFSLVLVGIFVWLAGMGELLQVRARTYFESSNPNGQTSHWDAPYGDSGEVIDADDVRPIR